MADVSGDCSGHGIYFEGQCNCLVQFSGEDCSSVNAVYFLVFGSIFSSVCFVATCQLLLCILSEYQQDCNKSWKKACGITIQKFLYTLVIFAAALRSAYFFSKWRVFDYAAYYLWFAYFPVLITGSSLLICSWAENVHVTRTQTPRFLSKSVMAFVLFNVALYVLFCTVFIISDIVPDTEEVYVKAYNGSVAVIVIILVILFTVYGVELYFKIRGAFASSNNHIEVDRLQVAMSRLGLLSEAFLQLLMGLFLVTDVITDHWENVFTILGQNCYDLIFRCIEFGVVVWFPCVLWNCRRPDELWVLNPRMILKSLDIQQGTQKSIQQPHQKSLLKDDLYTQPTYNTFDRRDSISSTTSHDCWICYDPERVDVGPLLQPCRCKGDVATVHHGCLKKWLVESADGDEIPSCKVCKQQYQVKTTSSWIPHGFSLRYLGLTTALVTFIVGSPIATYFICRLSIHLYYKALVTGCTAIVEMCSVRVLLNTILSIRKRVIAGSMDIIGKEVTSHRKELDTHRPIIRTNNC